MNKLSDRSELISVVVPIYRVEKYLNDCAKSIQKQTYEELEIIPVDDGSDDACAVLCDHMALSDSRTVVIHKPNGGLSDARNAGIELMSGDYIAFIDSDDWVDDNYIKKLLSVAVKEKADVVTCALINEYENTDITSVEKRNYFSGNSEEALTMLYDQTKIGVNAFKLYKRYIWETLRFPFGKLYEDALTTYKVFDLANRIVQISDGLYHYRIRDNSIMTAPFSLKIVGISDAWKENYLFCKEKYPKVAPYAHGIWLEMLPRIIAQFPSNMNEEEKKAKGKLKREIIDSTGFILKNMPIKKIYHLVRAVCFL